jgi:lipid II:glycine glycyltransferase (peptidoglycan interpeptide bridge formation enzyme)
MKINFFQGNQEEWNNFLIENDGSFLQSFEWGEFQKSLQKKIWRFEIKEKEKKLAEAQVIKEAFSFGKSLFYIPYGPCFQEGLFLKEKKEVLYFILKELKKLAKKEKTIFLKVESVSPLPKISEGVKSLKRFQPPKTLILKLKDKSEEDLFIHFHPKTRYNIRLAEKKGVRVITTNNQQLLTNNYFDGFYKLIQKTAKRKKIKPYSKNYYRKLLEIMSAELFLACFKEKIIAANIVIFFGGGATYLHGASNYRYRKLMAPHLLQWSQIKEAKNKGCEIYDFWGIDEEKWPGLTRFKKGFGGEELQYPEGEDFVFSNFWYKTYKILRRILFKKLDI